MLPSGKNIQRDVEHEQKKGKIGPVKKGALHSELHIAQGKKIGMSTLEHEKAVAKRTHNTKLMRRVVFAENFGHKK